jgi:hypothetical protein
MMVNAGSCVSQSRARHPYVTKEGWNVVGSSRLPGRIAVTSGLAAKVTWVGVPQVGQKLWDFSFPLSPAMRQVLAAPVMLTAAGPAKTM